MRILVVVAPLLLAACPADKPKPPETEQPVAQPAEPAPPTDAPARSKLADKILACPDGTQLVTGESERHCEKGGEKHGPSYKFHDEETLAESGEWQDGKRHGKFTTYYEDGSKRAEASFVDDVQHGPYRAWRKDGSVEADVEYVDGKPKKR